MLRFDGTWGLGGVADESSFLFRKNTHRKFVKRISLLLAEWELIQRTLSGRQRSAFDNLFQFHTSSDSTANDNFMCSHHVKWRIQFIDSHSSASAELWFCIKIDRGPWPIELFDHMNLWFLNLNNLFFFLDFRCQYGCRAKTASDWTETTEYHKNRERLGLLLWQVNITLRRNARLIKKETDQRTNNKTEIRFELWFHFSLRSK